MTIEIVIAPDYVSPVIETLLNFDSEADGSPHDRFDFCWLAELNGKQYAFVDTQYTPGGDDTGKVMQHMLDSILRKANFVGECAVYRNADGTYSID